MEKNSAIFGFRSRNRQLANLMPYQPDEPGSRQSRQNFPPDLFLFFFPVSCLFFFLERGRNFTVNVIVSVSMLLLVFNISIMSCFGARHPMGDLWHSLSRGKDMPCSKSGYDGVCHRFSLSFFLFNFNLSDSSQPVFVYKVRSYLSYPDSPEY